jgi:type IV pilus assembly protein PilM
MTKLFYREKSLLGIDIGQTSIKAMAIDQAHGEVTCFGSVDVDPDHIQEAIKESQVEYIVDHLTTLLNDKLIGTLSSRAVAVSIPAAYTYTRMLNIPLAAERSLKSAVELEAEQYIPVPVSGLNIDYQIISRSAEQLSVLVCAAPKSIINLATEALAKVNLTTVAVEPSLMAVARLLRHAERASLPTIVVDIGAVVTDIAAIENESITVTSSVPVGGNTFTLDISHACDTSLEQAHQLKVLHGLNVGSKQKMLTGALAPGLDAIVGEVKKIIRFYNDRLGGATLEQLLIVGGGANIPGIGEYFTNALVIASRVANPWQTLNFGHLTPPARQLKPRYLTVAGLASVNSQEVLS